MNEIHVFLVLSTRCFFFFPLDVFSFEHTANDIFRIGNFMIVRLRKIDQLQAPEIHMVKLQVHET